MAPRGGVAGILSTPCSRAISSIKSTSRFRSTRKVGMRKVHRLRLAASSHGPSLETDDLQAELAQIDSISPSQVRLRATALTLAWRSVISLGFDRLADRHPRHRAPARRRRFRESVAPPGGWPNRNADVGPALEAIGGLAAQAERFGGAADVRGLEVGALDQHIPRVVR